MSAPARSGAAAVTVAHADRIVATIRQERAERWRRRIPKEGTTVATP